MAFRRSPVRSRSGPPSFAHECRRRMPRRSVAERRAGGPVPPLNELRLGKPWPSVHAALRLIATPIADPASNCRHWDRRDCHRCGASSSFPRVLCSGVAAPTLPSRSDARRQATHFVSSCSSRAHHHRNNRPSAARTGAILASVSTADFALALRKAFQSPSARWWRRSVR